MVCVSLQGSEWNASNLSELKELGWVKNNLYTQPLDHRPLSPHLEEVTETWHTVHVLESLQLIPTLQTIAWSSQVHVVYCLRLKWGYM